MSPDWNGIRGEIPLNLEQVIEPFLLRQGLIKRGRILTENAYHSLDHPANGLFDDDFSDEA